MTAHRRVLTATHPAPLYGWVVVLVVAALSLLATAPPASAHAYVEATVPAADAVLDAAPAEVRVSFDDAVRAPIAAIRVYDLTSQRVDVGEATIAADDPRTVVGHVPDDLAAGTYVVTWRAVSWDNHTIIGSFSFSIGGVGSTMDAADATVAATLGATLGDGDVPAGIELTGGLARLATAVGTILTAGAGLLFLLVLRARPDTWEGDRRAVRRLVTRAARLGLLGTLVALAVHPVELAGASGFAQAPGAAMLDALVSPFGAAAVARALALLPLALGVRTPHGEVLLTLWAFALASLAIDGHAATEAPVWLSLASDMVHLVAAAAWLGGMVALLAVLRRRLLAGDHLGATFAVERFSGLAAASLAAVAASGAVLGLVMVGSPAAMTTTTYGRTLLVKLVLVAVVVALGAANRWWLLPAVRRQADAGGALLRLRRLLRAEAVVLLAVVAVTGVLTRLPTASEAAGADARVTAQAVDELAGGRDVSVVAEPDGPPLVNLLALAIAATLAGAHTLARHRRREEADRSAASGEAAPGDQTADTATGDDGAPHLVAAR